MLLCVVDLLLEAFELLNVQESVHLPGHSGLPLLVRDVLLGAHEGTPQLLLPLLVLQQPVVTVIQIIKAARVRSLPISVSQVVIRQVHVPRVPKLLPMLAISLAIVRLRALSHLSLNLLDLFDASWCGMIRAFSRPPVRLRRLAAHLPRPGYGHAAAS